MNNTQCVARIVRLVGPDHRDGQDTVHDHDLMTSKWERNQRIRAIQVYNWTSIRIDVMQC